MIMKTIINVIAKLLHKFLDYVIRIIQFFEICIYGTLNFPSEKYHIEQILELFNRFENPNYEKRLFHKDKMIYKTCILKCVGDDKKYIDIFGSYSDMKGTLRKSPMPLISVGSQFDINLNSVSIKFDDGLTFHTLTTTRFCVNVETFNYLLQWLYRLRISNAFFFFRGFIKNPISTIISLLTFVDLFLSSIAYPEKYYGLVPFKIKRKHGKPLRFNIVEVCDEEWELYVQEYEDDIKTPVENCSRVWSSPNCLIGMITVTGSQLDDTFKGEPPNGNNYCDPHGQIQYVRNIIYTRLANTRIKNNQIN
jgi:hypothetical protein